MSGKRAQFRSAFEDCSPATAGKTGQKWDLSPLIAADSLLPRRFPVAATAVDSTLSASNPEQPAPKNHCSNEVPIH